MIIPLTAACIAGAAALFQVPEPLLWTILKTEGGRVGACILQTNGTHDCGPAQINSETWAPRLAFVLRRSEAAVRTDLRDDGCFNIWAAGYVLSVNLRVAGGDLWDAAGRYNSATPSIKLSYQEKLRSAYQSLFSPGRTTSGSKPKSTG